MGFSEIALVLLNAVFLFAVVVGLVITMDACMPRSEKFEVKCYLPKWSHKKIEEKK